MIIVYDYMPIYSGGYNMDAMGDHQNACRLFQSEFERLSQIAVDLQKKRSQLEAIRDADTVRREFASNSDLHRGVYCPSPVYDLIVGSTHRGKLLNRVTARSKSTHTYGFDARRRLLWCDSIYDNQAVYTEYLIYQDNIVHGITFDWANSVYIITEEAYQNGRITQYTHCLCPSLDGSAQCVELRREDYEYDEDGLCRCTWHTYSNPSDLPPDSNKGIPSSFLMPTYNRSEYRFQRKDGFITSYTSDGITYYPRIRRKA